MPCPAGRYGSVDGLFNSSCSGPCPEGYYCPQGTDAADSNECGGSNYYCPLGSAKPLQVRAGYYSIGGNNEFTRSAEMICEIGFYCKNGLKESCPQGTFGNSTGLYADYYNSTSSVYYHSKNSTVQEALHFPTITPINTTSLPILQPIPPTRLPTPTKTRNPSNKPAVTDYPSYLPSSRPSSIPTGQLMETPVSTSSPTRADQRLYSRFFCSGNLLLCS